METSRNNSQNLKAQILNQPNTGLDRVICVSVVEILNNMLANEAVLTLKTRSAHWKMNVTGYLDRDTLFLVQYKQLNDVTDMISKRIRLLGGLPMGSFEEFLKNSRLKEQPGVVPGIIHLLADHETVIRFLREDMKMCSEQYEDEVTRSFLVDILSLHEKMAWMLRSNIENQPVHGESQ